MKVYAVLFGVKYEGFDIIGIYSTLKQAEKKCRDSYPSMEWEFKSAGCNTGPDKVGIGGAFLIIDELEVEV